MRFEKHKPPARPDHAPSRAARPGRDDPALVDHEIVVLKFGSSILADEARIANAVHEVYRETRKGRRVVVVCSAMGNTTDRLVARAGEISQSPHPAAYAALLAVGESHSSAQVALALDAAGLPATLLDPAQIDFRTSGDPVDAEPASMDPRPITRELRAGHVVVIPGFAGRDARGFTTLLGRGGTDLSALFIAHHIGAGRCRLSKDVDGWFDGNPKDDPNARKYAALSYDDALASPAKIVQPKCVKYAAEHALTIEVGAIGSDEPTRVSDEPTRHSTDPGGHGPVRVALLGLGTVGGGVLRHMLALPDKYDVRRILVRDPARHADKLEDPSVLTSDPHAVLDDNPHLVVEVIGGTALAADCIERALNHGASVASANKALMAARGVELHALASANNALLEYAAAVGGGVTMLETVRNLARTERITSLTGVLNGTTNFILDRMAAGASYADALAEAQRLGFAEADPTADVAGHDAAQKLCLLCRAAFDPVFPADAVDTAGINHLAEGAPPAGKGMTRRLVARAVRGADGAVAATVRLEEVPTSSELASVRDEQNVLIAQLDDGRRDVVFGRGAGRWPTAESVFGDCESIVSALRARANT